MRRYANALYPLSALAKNILYSTVRQLPAMERQKIKCVMLTKHKVLLFTALVSEHRFFQDRRNRHHALLMVFAVDDDKIVVNVASGEAGSNSKMMDAILSDLSKITGQKPVITKAKKSIANFKLREGMNVGAKVTLRGERMYEFLDRFFNVALPRVRDFRGINPNSFDGRGNYSVGIKEQLIFPEIDYDKIDKIRGMDITFITTAKTDEEARELLTLMGAPFEK